MKKVLLYLASNSPFYTNLYPSIKRGFQEAGCLVEGGANLLESKELIEKIDSFKPDFVFEMNRVKSEIQDFPEGVIHICWLVDFWGRVHEDFIGSDILYTWAEDWVKHFKRVGLKNVFYLPPATDKAVYKLKKDVEKNVDLLFLGHISNNWSSKELKREIGVYEGKKLFFHQLAPLIEEFVLAKHHTETFLNSLQRRGFYLKKPIDKTLLYDISNRSFRQIRREHYVDLFLKLDKSIEIYGSPNWNLYEKYKDFYKGYIENPLELNEKIQNANVLLHDGNYPHFRTFDAMASGTAVAAAKAHDDYGDPWLALDFIDKQDYINVDIYNEDVDLSILNDKKKLKDISQNARKKVLENHLWVHRIEQVLRDIDRLKKEIYVSN